MPSTRFNMTTSNSVCLTSWEGSIRLTVVRGHAVDKMVEGRIGEFINHQIVRHGLDTIPDSGTASMKKTEKIPILKGLMF